MNLTEEQYKERLLKALSEWMFHHAKQMIEAYEKEIGGQLVESEIEEVIVALSHTFRNPGYMAGRLGTVLQFIVDKLIEEVEKGD